MTAVAHLFASVGLVMVVLLTNHPHLAHLMGPFASEIRGGSLSFGFGFEHRLLRLSAWSLAETPANTITDAADTALSTIATCFKLTPLLNSLCPIKFSL